MKQPEIWTIGHSTHPIEEFLAYLKSFSIELLVDVRSLPGSNKFPHFNRERLEKSLEDSGIQYSYIEKLGGRRKFNANSTNTIWRNKSFRSYADYMETEGFQEGLAELKKLAATQRAAIMCAEAVWWRCHRSMISDALKAEGWKVEHIMGKDKEQEHPYTAPAHIVDGKLVYGKADDELL